MFMILGRYLRKCERKSAWHKGHREDKSDISLVDENLAWHHSSTATALWSGDFDVQLFAEVYVETKTIKSRLIRVNYHLLFTRETS